VTYTERTTIIAVARRKGTQEKGAGKSIRNVNMNTAGMESGFIGRLASGEHAVSELIDQIKDSAA